MDCPIKARHSTVKPREIELKSIDPIQAQAREAKEWICGFQIKDAQQGSQTTVVFLRRRPNLSSVLARKTSAEWCATVPPAERRERR